MQMKKPQIKEEAIINNPEAIINNPEPSQDYEDSSSRGCYQAVEVKEEDGETKTIRYVRKPKSLLY